MKERVIYIDILRILATFAVVLLHSASSFWYTNPTTINWQFSNFYDGLVRWCVPMFVTISGALFLRDNKERSNIKSEYKKIISKNIFRILTALIIWSIAYKIYTDIANNSAVLNKEFIKLFLKIFVYPIYYHLWFLYLIIGLYILAPLLKIFTKNATKQEVEIFLILFLTFGLGLNLANSLLEFFGFSPIYFNKNLPELGGYIGYFIAGFYFTNFTLSKKCRKYLYILAFIFVLFTITGTSLLSIHIKRTEILYQNLTPHTAFITFAIFVFVKDKFYHYNFSQKASNLIVKTSLLTFGIYLIHALVLDLLKKQRYLNRLFYKLYGYFDTDTCGNGFCFINFFNISFIKNTVF